MPEAPASSSSRVLVYGAYGHTGRFVVAELLRRGLEPILSGRDPGKLASLHAEHPDLEARVAAVHNPRSLEVAITGAAAVINCAGPFLDTAVPVAAAAIRSGVPYLDVAPEQAAVQAVHREHATGASAAEVAVVPAMAFFGGLADLLATAVVTDGSPVDEISVAVALDRWWPTPGTRRTGQRNTARRLTLTNAQLTPVPDPPLKRVWTFPGSFGSQQMTEHPLAEVIVMATHLPTSIIHSYINDAALRDIADPATPAPQPVDDTGRSAQLFTVDVVAHQAGTERRITVGGRDIYAVTAPLVVEATVRVLDGRASTTGVVSPGRVFHAADFLVALSPEPLTISWPRDITEPG